MNMRDLEYFNCLCITKSFTKTAEILYVSQPSITMALKRLENELGTKLIIRNHSPKQIDLTNTGKAFQKRVNNILYEIKEAKMEIGRIKGGKIKLGVPPIIGAYYFPTIMKELAKRNLVKYIKLVETGSVAMEKLIKSCDVDIALIGSVKPKLDNILKNRILDTDEFMVCISRDSILSKRDKIDFMELANQKFITLGDGYVHNHVLKILCKRNNISTDDFYYTDEIQTAKSLTASGLGVSLMVSKSVRDMDSIKAIHLNDSITFYISIAFKKNHYITSVERNIVDTILTSSKKFNKV